MRVCYICVRYHTNACTYQLSHLVFLSSAVRVIDAKLKCVLEIMIPPSANEEIKQAGKPLFDSIAVASRFIFIPSISQMQVCGHHVYDLP